MWFLSAFLLLQGIAATPLPRRDDHDLFRRSESTITSYKPKKFADATSLEVTKNVASLSKTTGKSRSTAELLRASKSGSAPLLQAGFGGEYTVDIVYGSTNVQMAVDTGSSDTWLIKEGFNCVDVNQAPQPESTCMFGPTYNSTFEDSISNENFNTSYSSGEFLAGTLGYEDITLAGIDVKHQESALVDVAYWEGDNVTSGLIGFGYPSLTSAYTGTNPAVDNENTNLVEYSPFITSAITQGLISPMFSLALERGMTDGGYIALGGLPPVSFDQNFTSVPIEITQLVPQPSTTTQYSFYTIYPDGFLVEGEYEEATGYNSINPNPATNFPMIVDSGTTLLNLPNGLAEQFNALYEPPSVYIEEAGVYENYCDAIPPSFAVRIGGVDFYINAADLILNAPDQVDPDTGGCITAIQPVTDAYTLGDVFLKNVVAVFDIGAAEMRFAKHENY